jgi:hypothetical protein
VSIDYALSDRFSPKQVLGAMSPGDSGSRARHNEDVPELYGASLVRSEADDSPALAAFAVEASVLSQLVAAAANSARADAERSARSRMPSLLWVGAAMAAGVVLGTASARLTRPVPVTHAPVSAIAAASLPLVAPRVAAVAPPSQTSAADPPAVLPRQARVAHVPVADVIPRPLAPELVSRAAPGDSGVSSREEAIIVRLPDARPVVEAAIEAVPVANEEERAIAGAALALDAMNAGAIDLATGEFEIHRLLEAYEESYDRRDAVSAAMLWPGVDTGALSRAFSTLASQDLAFDHCAVEVLGGHATATCNGSLEYVRRVGNHAPQSRPLAWTFELDRRAGRWLISRVTAR